MNDYFELLLEKNVGNYVDESIHLLGEGNQAYDEYQKELGIAEEKYMKLNLAPEQRKVVDDYIIAYENYHSAYSDLAFQAGCRDAIRMMESLKLIKNMEE